MLVLVLIAFVLHALTTQIYIKANSSNASSIHHEISPLLTAKYLALRLFNKTESIGLEALDENDPTLWRKYHYLQNLLFTRDNLAKEIGLSTAKFQTILREERGLSDNELKIFKMYYSPSGN